MHYHAGEVAYLASKNKIVAYYGHVKGPTYGPDIIEHRIISVIYVPIISPITFLRGERAISRGVPLANLARGGLAFRLSQVSAYALWKLYDRGT
jgi:hypothetical protein